MLDGRFNLIWAQQKIPVIVHRGNGRKLRVRLPFYPNNRAWLGQLGRINPIWNAAEKFWVLPTAWFEKLVKRAVERYPAVYVVQLFKEQQKCAPACWNAEGIHCECSCMGANHGSGQPNGHWFIVSDTFAFSWGDERFASRLLRAR